MKRQSSQRQEFSVNNNKDKHPVKHRGALCIGSSRAQYGRHTLHDLTCTLACLELVERYLTEKYIITVRVFAYWIISLFQNKDARIIFAFFYPDQYYVTFCEVYDFLSISTAFAFSWTYIFLPIILWYLCSPHFPLSLPAGTRSIPHQSALVLSCTVNVTVSRYHNQRWRQKQSVSSTTVWINW